MKQTEEGYYVDCGNHSVWNRQRKVILLTVVKTVHEKDREGSSCSFWRQVYETKKDRPFHSEGRHVYETETEGEKTNKQKTRVLFTVTTGVWNRKRSSSSLLQPESTKQTEKDHVLTMATRVYEADRERSCFDYGNQSVWNRQKRDHPVDYGNHSVRKCLLNFLSCSLCTEHRMVDLLCNSKSELKGSNRLSELVNHQSNLVLSFLFFFFFFRLEIWKGHRRTRNQRTCVKITKPSN